MGASFTLLFEVFMVLSLPSRPAPLRLAIAQRSPRRLSVTIPFTLHQQLLDRSDLEGRSVSNLAAYLLERGLNS